MSRNFQDYDVWQGYSGARGKVFVRGDSSIQAFNNINVFDLKVANTVCQQVKSSSVTA